MDSMHEKDSIHRHSRRVVLVCVLSPAYLIHRSLRAVMPLLLPSCDPMTLVVVIEVVTVPVPLFLD